MSSSNSKEISTRALRGSWSDAKRAAYLMEREIERSFKKDPGGKEYLTSLLQTMVEHLNDVDRALEKTERFDLSVSLAGSNNFNLATWEGKLAVILPEYIRLMAEQGIDVQLVKRRRVIAQLVPNAGQAPNENKETPFIERRRQA